ncbi:LysR family transcriptional regulator [Herbaspirillum robiniae]|uniref:LysR family transcriptional regulator n=1 Tax=Herbaspirillum robiniae TaxID=2014887 RepID=A0ABX2M4H8_9BURK|nr:LysR family transcriptional regulator [Herbaspirillum robiniae]NUU03151.1 LysR family transcriptional regulator [Herbaspirillum robiniae]
MDRIHLMTVFVAVGEEQNFAAAAHRLGMSRPTVTRAISNLEEALGVKLVLRTTRSVRLTDVGSRYLDDVRAILARISDADEAATGTNRVMQGHLNVTAPVLFGNDYVLPCIAAYLDNFPAMSISGYFLDRVVNLVEEGMDVAVRIGHLPDSSLKAIRVGSVRRVLCASPAYLKSRGVPLHPEDLGQHAIVAATGVSPKIEWRFGRDERDISVRIAPRLAVTSNDAAVHAALLGVGITRLLSYQVARHLAEGSLQAVLTDYEEEPWPIHVVHGESRYGAPKVREFIDMLVSHLRKHPDLR